MENDYIDKLDFCGCGNPEAAKSFILKVLEFIDKRLKMEWKNIEKTEKRLFKNQGIKYFVYYWLDHKEFTEHGGCVPGWLTEKGKNILKELKDG